MQTDPTHATLLIPLLRQDDAWLERCVASALGQTMPCEVLVVTSIDTPSSNLEVLSRLAAPNLHVVQRPVGVRFPGALNLGFRRATHPRVGLVLSDDWLEPDALEQCLAIDADIVSSRASVWDADGVTRLLDLDRPRQGAAFAAIPIHERRAHYLGHFLLLSRDAVLAAGGVDETVGDSPGVDDYHLLWTMLERGCTAAICEHALYNYRDHEGERLTNRKPLDMLATMDRIIAKHGLAPLEHERLLAWHARWFGRPLQHCVTRDGRERRLRRADDALARARAEGVDPRVVTCLQIDGDATLDEHARRLAQCGALPESTALAGLGAALVAGLLVASDPPRTPVAKPRTAKGTTPTTVAIITCGEDELGARALQQWRAQLHEHGHDCRILVADDSRRDTDREAIAGHAARAGADYLGAAQKLALAAELASASGVDREILDTALFDPLGSGYTLGANLNAMLLATAGEVVLSVDQDIECTTYRPPLGAGVTMTRTEFPDPPRWFVDDADKAAFAARCDVLAEHGAWLGRSVAARRGGNPAVVAASWMGVMGSVGYADATSEVLSSATRSLRCDAERLRRVLAHPRALRCPSRVTLNDGAGFTSSTIGLDNRELLPPFLPVGRGIDLLAGLMITVCRPGSMFAFLPWALAHERPTAQRDSNSDASPLWFTIAMFVARMAERMCGTSPAQRMRELGAGLVAVSRLPDDVLTTAVGQIDAMRRHGQAARLRMLLVTSPDACATWRDGVGERLAKVEAPMPPRAPHDTPIVDGCDAWTSLRVVLQRYGALLQAWPALVAAARSERIAA